MQDLRNVYHSEEADLEQLEMDIDQEEMKRELTETQFFSLLYGAAKGGRRNSSRARSEDDAYVPPSRTSLLGIPADRPVDIHPLYRQLLDAVGDRELAREHHTDLLMHRDGILYDMEMKLKRDRLRDAASRPDVLLVLDDADTTLLKSVAANSLSMEELKAKFGSSIREADLEFLGDYEEQESNAQNSLDETKQEVERLRQLCIEKGVMRKNAPYHEEYTIFSDAGEAFPNENMSINHEHLHKKEDGLASLRFPILLSNPSHILEKEPKTPKTALREATKLAKTNPDRAQLVADSMKEFGISTLVVESNPDNKCDFINRWLLHKLRISPIEVELLFNVFSAKLKIRNIRRWQEDVLYFWSRDEANISKEEFEAPVTSRDTLEIDESDINWDNEKISRAGSLRGESPRQAVKARRRSANSWA
jgi:hypothetical protein